MIESHVGKVNKNFPNDLDPTAYWSRGTFRLSWSKPKKKKRRGRIEKRKCCRKKYIGWFSTKKWVKLLFKVLFFFNKKIPVQYLVYVSHSNYPHITG